MLHITERQYPDNNAALCHTKKLQQYVNNFAMAYGCFSLTVNIKKTKAPAYLASNTILPDFYITISDIAFEK